MNNDDWEQFKKTVSPLKNQKRQIRKQNKTFKTNQKEKTDKDFELLAKNFARIRNQLKITNDLLDKYKEYYETDVKEKQ